jgi:hypothetical protein
MKLRIGVLTATQSWIQVAAPCGRPEGALDGAHERLDERLDELNERLMRSMRGSSTSMRGS